WAAAVLSRGNQPIVAPTPPISSTTATSATGLPTSDRASSIALAGSVDNGILSAPADMMKMATTATYVVAQKRQTVCSWKYDAHPRYMTMASPTIDRRK